MHNFKQFLCRQYQMIHGPAPVHGHTTHAQAVGQTRAHSHERVIAVVCLSDQGQISVEG